MIGRSPVGHWQFADSQRDSAAAVGHAAAEHIAAVVAGDIVVAAQVVALVGAGSIAAGRHTVAAADAHRTRCQSGRNHQEASLNKEQSG